MIRFFSFSRSRFAHRPLAFWAAACFCFAPFPAKSFQDSDFSQTFPTPKILEPNVEFWKKVYGVYDEDQVMIHDKDDLEVIYEVVNFEDLIPNHESVSMRQKWKRIAEVKKGYAKAIRSLAGKIDSNGKLNVMEHQVLQAFGGSVTKDRLLRAARNIRGQQGLKQRFRKGIERAGLYMDKIRKTFREYNLPPALVYLPHVESSFNYKAYSKAGAAGLWQFTRSSARIYKMKVNYDIDERFDPVAATAAAARHLVGNYELLKSWPLSVTAYNHGPNGMRRAKRQFGDDMGTIVRRYKSRSFGFASRNFYAEFLAAYEVATNYEKYFGPVVPMKPIKYLSFKTKKYYSVSTLMTKFALTKKEFQRFNPALRPPVLRGQRRIPRNYTLHVPDRPMIDEKAVWASLSPAESFDAQVHTDWYKVRRGDNLAAIARRVNSSIPTLMEYNNLANAHRIYIGQILKIPPKENARKPEPKPSVVLADISPVRPKTSPKPAVTKAPAPKVTVSDKTDVGSSPSKAASKSEKSIEKKPVIVELPELLEPTNGLATPITEIAPPNMRLELAAGEKAGYILIASEEPREEVREIGAKIFVPQPVSEWIAVEPEETLGHYAEWLEITARELRRINNFASNREIQIGQKIHLSYEKVNPEEFQRRRFEFQQSIEEDFLTSFSIEGVKTHTVKRGQSIWYITNRLYDLPLWLIVKYNPGRELRELHIGDQVNIPVVVEKQEPQRGM